VNSQLSVFILHVPFCRTCLLRNLDVVVLVSVFFLSQSRVIAVDKEEAAVDLTRENAHRYKPTYYPFFLNCFLRKTRSPQYLDMWFIFITTGKQKMFNCLNSWSL